MRSAIFSDRTDAAPAEPSTPRRAGAATSSPGCEASSNSRNRPVTRKATCSPTSTALSPIRSSARATSIMVIAHSRRSCSSPISIARWKHSLFRLSITSSWRTRSRAMSMSRSSEGALRLPDLPAQRLAHRHQVLQHPLVRGRLVAGDRDQLGDVDALVAHPLDVLHHVQEGGDQAQVGGHGRLGREQRQDRLVDLQVAAVDHVVVGDHQLGQLDVLVLDRLDGALERRDHQVEAVQGPPLEPLELLAIVEADLVRGHQPTLPVT